MQTFLTHTTMATLITPPSSISFLSSSLFIKPHLHKSIRSKPATLPVISFEGETTDLNNKLNMLTPRTLNLFDILNADKLVFTQAGLDCLNEVDWENTYSPFDDGEDIAFEYEKEEEKEDNEGTDTKETLWPSTEGEEDNEETEENVSPPSDA